MNEITIEKLYETYLRNPVITTDSRKIAPGCMFFALKGDNFDGNQFASRAISDGASYAVVDDRKCAGGERFLLVDDVLSTLQALASYHRNHLTIPVIGITGSNGKTTTKELTGAVLSQKFNTLTTQGNLNNHIGVPLSVLGIKPETEIAIIEMGANHQGEIARLCKIAQPTYGIITNIGKAHLEGFGGFEGVIRAKSELYGYIRENSGTIFINGSDSLLNDLAGDIPKFKYGNEDDSIVRGKITGESPFLGLEIQLENILIQVNSQLVGAYNFSNMLAAACIGHHFGVEPADIRAAIENYKPENNRSQFIRTSSNRVVMDAYNANPSSMEAAISNFSKLPDTNKALILGDMLELGDESIREHKKILELAQSSGSKEIFLVGNNFSEISRNSSSLNFLSVDDLIGFIKNNPLRGKTILIKGSRGIRLEKLLTVL